MSTEANKAIARRIFDLFHEGGEAQVGEVIAEDFVHHSWPWASPGVAGLKELMAMVAEGFSDFEATIEDVIAEGDKVVMRISERGVHSGELFGMPATNKRFHYTAIHIVRIEDGKIAEHWREQDTAALMQQLGG